ncbi:MAG: YfhL family 4Fe-4S dicluster ferredoxin [Alphaproteobacteria bacterium]
MATTITDDCISCGACEPECPNTAISQADPIYIIDPQLCTECVGFHDYEACAAVCPVDCCVPDPKNIEAEDVLIARARALHKETDFGDSFPSRFRKGEAEHKAPAAAAPVSVQATVAALAAEATAEPAPKVAAETPAEPAAEATPTVESKPVPITAPVASPPAQPKTEPPPKPAPVSPAAEPKAASAPAAAPVAAKAPPAQPLPKPIAPAKKEAPSKKTFPNELTIAFEEVSKRYASSGSLKAGFSKWLVIFAQPLLGALPHESKKSLEAAVQSPLFTAAGSTGLNIVLNAVLYPLICMAVAVLVRGPSILFSQAINSYVLVGILLAAAEAVYRLKDGIFSPKPADEMVLRPSIYGAALGLVARPLLEKHTGLIRDLPIPFDGFYSQGFVEKLERERRYGNVYTIEDRGGALLLRLEFPRLMPDSGLSLGSQLPSDMPDYDYDLALKNGQFIVKGRCTDERVRKISSSFGAFPPEFTTVIPLRERITGFAHRCQNKLLEVFLIKEGNRWSESHQ